VNAVLIVHLDQAGAVAHQVIIEATPQVRSETQVVMRVEVLFIAVE